MIKIPVRLDSLYRRTWYSRRITECDFKEKNIKAHNHRHFALWVNYMHFICISFAITFLCLSVGRITLQITNVPSCLTCQVSVARDELVYWEFIISYFQPINTDMPFVKESIHWARETIHERKSKRTDPCGHHVTRPKMLSKETILNRGIFSNVGNHCIGWHKTE